MQYSLVAFFFLTVIFSCHNRTQPKATAIVAPVCKSPECLDSLQVLQGLMYHRLDSLFLRRHKAGFNGNVLILKGNRILYKACFGYCNYKEKDTLNAQTPFQIASSSKPFTASAILRLADEGKLSLTDTLGKFFPGFPYHGITVAMLLSHRSGLPNYLYFGDKLWKSKEYLTNDALIDLFMNNKKIEGTSRAGTHFQYNNSNYALLASIVERVTGQKFPEYMKVTFFEPLGMKNTWIRDVTNDKSERKHAISYNSKWEKQKEDPYDGIYGDKNVFSTIEDMMIWDHAFYEHTNLSAAMQEEAYTPRSMEHKGVRNYGYGWRLMKQPDGSSLIYHNGWWHGNNTVFYRYLPDTLTVIILSNRYNRGVYDIQPVFNILSSRRDTAAWKEEE